MPDSVLNDITKEEEDTILFYYQVKMLDLCEFLKTPIQVQSTSITYFKVLFTKKRVFHYDMRNLIVACVFLAMKVENIYVTAECIKSRLGFVKVSLLVQYEVDICNALKFNFHVSSPYLRLLGLFLLLKNKERIYAELDGPVPTQQIEEIDRMLNWEKSIENLKNIMLADDYLQLNPNEVALASLAVRPSELQGFFMPDTLEAVKKIKMHTIRREAPNQEQLKMINEKIQAIQRHYSLTQS
ncbi:cyclin H [Nematocida homosporus]|uniref:cyclin H n=1 Tax=Nematocida homosporus TaxID=1912981 RepID=UPI00222037DC|nr:cyclin H [Nematocida homosporus]KAI5186159.1 cyclin H [Nematocida homosporus]